MPASIRISQGVWKHRGDCLSVPFRSLRASRPMLHSVFRLAFSHQKPQIGLMSHISCMARAVRAQQAAIATAPRPDHTDLISWHLLEVSETGTCKTPAIRQGFRWRSKMFQHRFALMPP